MSAAPAVFALAGGSFIFLGFVVALFFAVVFGFYTFAGSAINAHPSDGLDGAPGSEAPSEASGKGRSPGPTSEGHSVGDTFSSHGTR